MEALACSTANRSYKGETQVLNNGSETTIPVSNQAQLLGKGGNANVFLDNGQTIKESSNHEPGELTIAYAPSPKVLEILIRLKAISGADPNKKSEVRLERIDDTNKFTTTKEKFYLDRTINGTSLVNKIDNSELSFNDKVKYALELFVALLQVHREGIMHKDINPKNIMIDKSGALTLIDLGFASSYENNPENKGFFTGTLEYMDPWVPAMGVEDKQVDIYAAFLTMFEIFGLDEGHAELDKLLEKLPEQAEDIFEQEILDNLVGLLRPITKKLTYRAKEYRSNPELKKAVAKERKTVKADHVVDALHQFIKNNHLEKLLDYKISDYKANQAFNRLLVRARSNLSTCLQSLYKQDYQAAEKLINDIEAKFLSKNNNNAERKKALEEYLNFTELYKESFLLEQAYEENLEKIDTEFLDGELKPELKNIFESKNLDLVSILSILDFDHRAVLSSVKEMIILQKFKLSVAKLLRYEPFHLIKKDFMAKLNKHGLKAKNLQGIQEFTDELNSRYINISRALAVLDEYRNLPNNISKSVLSSSDFDYGLHTEMLQSLYYLKQDISKLKRSTNMLGNQEQEKELLIEFLITNDFFSDPRTLSEKFYKLQYNLELIKSNTKQQQQL